MQFYYYLPLPRSDPAHLHRTRCATPRSPSLHTDVINNKESAALRVKITKFLVYKNNRVIKT